MSIEELIQKIERTFPDLISQKKLIKLGIFSSRHEAGKRRSRGQEPEFISLSARNYVYPKSSITSWLRSRADLSYSKADTNRKNYNKGNSNE